MNSFLVKEERSQLYIPPSYSNPEVRQRRNRPDKLSSGFHDLLSVRSPESETEFFDTLSYFSDLTRESKNDESQSPENSRYTGIHMIVSYQEFKRLVQICFITFR
jgi:hypothetical protein